MDRSRVVFVRPVAKAGFQRREKLHYACMRIDLPSWLSIERLDWALLLYQAALIIIVVATIPPRSSRTRRFLRRFSRLRTPALWAATACVMILSIIFVLSFVNDSIKKFNSSSEISSVVVTGVGLYCLRRTNQLIYGLMEASVALLTSFIAVGIHQATQFQRLGALAAATYFIVRALVNVEDGWRKGCWPRKRGGAPPKPAL